MGEFSVFKDLTGNIYGRLTVIKQEGWKLQTNGKRRPTWLCKCECGNEKVICGNLGRSTNSCGCLHSEKAAERVYKHGYQDEPIYQSFNMMKQRCVNPKNPAYVNYGARGITVCDRWLEPDGKGFLNFLEDMGERPEGTSLDRVNNDKGYSKENCRWVGRGTQGFNQRKSSLNTSGKTGVHLIKKTKTWKASIGFQGKEITLGYSKDLDVAIALRVAAELKYYGVTKP